MKPDFFLVLFEGNLSQILKEPFAIFPFFATIAALNQFDLFSIGVLLKRALANPDALSLIFPIRLNGEFVL